MNQQGCCRFQKFQGALRLQWILIAVTSLLTGCVGGLWTGASLVYDRHNVYKTVSDYQLQAETLSALHPDAQLKCSECVIDVAAFKGDILVAGHLPSENLLSLAGERVSRVDGQRRLFNQLHLGTGQASMQDAWITAKIRSQIFVDDSIDPKAFKVITADRIVYLMGDVDKAQAEKVILIARQTTGVEHVVKMMKYLSYK